MPEVELRIKEIDDITTESLREQQLKVFKEMINNLSDKESEHLSLSGVSFVGKTKQEIVQVIKGELDTMNRTKLIRMTNLHVKEGLIKITSIDSKGKRSDFSL